MKVNELLESNSQFFTTRRGVKAWLDTWNIENFTINDDLSVDVNGDVDIKNSNFTKFPVQFGKVDGNFKCFENRNLISLIGCPSYVKGEFNVFKSEALTSLEGAPKVVLGKNFYCHSCPKLTSLHNIHKYVKRIDGTFYCAQNSIKSHILGLLRIEGLKSATFSVAFAPTFEKIINKYIPLGDIVECQAELIEAGLDAYAQL